MAEAAAEAADSTASSEVNDDTETAVNPAELLASAKEHLKNKEYDESIDEFSKYLDLKIKVHGEMAFDCADAYYQYGNALMQKIQDSTDATDLINRHAEQQNNDDENGASGDEDEEEDGDENEPDKDDDNFDPREEAFYVMESSRVIYTKYLEKLSSGKPLQDVPLEFEEQFRKYMAELCKERLGQVHLNLGDIGVDNDDFDQAILDYQKSLDYKKQCEKRDPRGLTTIHVQMAVAYLFSKRPSKAIEEYRLVSLMLEEAIAKMQGDVGEFQSLLKDVKERIDDLKEGIKEMEEFQKSQALSVPVSFSGGSSSSASATFSFPHALTSAGTSSQQAPSSTTVNIIEPKRRPKPAAASQSSESVSTPGSQQAAVTTDNASSSKRKREETSDDHQSDETNKKKRSEDAPPDCKQQ